MVIGNPYAFAILCDEVKAWNIDGTFCNGLFLYFLNGVAFPPQVTTATLRCEIPGLPEKFKAPSVNHEIFHMSKEAAFTAIYNITFSDSTVDSDNHFDITPVSFSDQDCFVFAVSDGFRVRVLASTLTYLREESRHCLEGIKIEEVFVSVEDFRQMGKRLEDMAWVTE